MILDTSAIIAVLLEEEGSIDLRAKIRSAKIRSAGTPTLTVTGVVLTSHVGLGWETMLEIFLNDFKVEAIHFDQRHWREAVTAYCRFGKGRHPARLNFGDCMSYAVSRIAGRPLLCTGRDFAQTDLELA